MRLIAFVLAVVVGLFALGSIALATDGLALHIRVPAGYDPEKTYVLVGQYGKGLALEPARRDPSSTGFMEHIGDGYTSAKVLIYYPGCKLVTAELQREDMSQPFTPVFHKLKMVPLKVRFRRTDGTPVANQPITLIQSIPEMKFFGYADGMTYSIYTAPAASGVTDASGEVTVQVPALLDDPLYTSLKVKPGFEVYLGSGPARDLFDRSKGELVPDFIPARDSYAEPILIQLIQHGTVSGKVEESFFTRNGVDGTGSSEVLFCVNASKGGGACNKVKPDGLFSMSAMPGSYDLIIEIHSGGKTTQLPVQKGFVLHEGENKQFTVK